MRVNLKQNKQLNRPLVLASVMLGMFLAAIEGTIIATAMPSIVAELGGFSLYSWVFSAYLLTNASTVLIFGKLSDIYGRKPIFIIGIFIFLSGSLLAGLSMSMGILIIARFIQGLGAGALMPIAMTIVGDIYDKTERAKIQGYLSSVWGISAVLGPLLGGIFVDVLNWRYVFLMNIPLGIFAVIGIIFFFHEKIIKDEATIDLAGISLIFIAVSTLMIILTEGGLGSSWGSPLFIILVIVSVTCFLLFVFIERRTKTPMLPFHLWDNRLLLISNLASLTTGMIIIGVSSYSPAFVQGVMGKSATIAGFTLTTMSIGWPIASTIAGRVFLTLGYRKTSLIGGISLIIGGVIFYYLSPEKGPIWAGTGSFFIGVGMGLTSTSFIIAIQSIVGWKIRGIATAAIMFMRSLGSAVGAAFFGGLLNRQIHQQLENSDLNKNVSIDAVNLLLDPNQSQTLQVEVKKLLTVGLSNGLHVIYTGLLCLAIGSFILIYFMPKQN